MVHEVLFFMCCFGLCRNIKWPPLIFSYSLRIFVLVFLVLSFLVLQQIIKRKNDVHLVTIYMISVTQFNSVNSSQVKIKYEFSKQFPCDS